MDQEGLDTGDERDWIALGRGGMRVLPLKQLE